MIIGFVTAYSAASSAGLERCTLDLLRSILAADTTNHYYIYTKKGSGLKELLASYRRARVIEIGWGKLWKDIGLFFAPKADIYVFNGQVVPLFLVPKKSIVIIYDFAYRQVPDLSFTARLKRVFIDLASRLSFRRARKIIAISQATKDEAVRLFAVAPDKIAVMHLGFLPPATLAPAPVANLSAKFFLFIGTVKERKNVLGLIQAYTIFRSSRPDYKLVIAGRYNPHSAYVRAIFSYLRKASAGNDVIWLGHVSDSELAWLYRRAMALVFPSLLEGFGFPVLEAMSSGLPVITSNSSSLPEVAGQAALLVDPTNPKEIVAAMSRLASEPALREELIKAGLLQAANFSWAKTAKEFIELIHLTPIDTF